MKIKLLKVITRGIKNIEENIELDFTNKTFDKIDLNKSNLKVIYGANGAGKSAIIDSISIYRGLCIRNDYLLQDKYQEYLKGMINKKINEFYIKTYFTIKDNDITNPSFIYSHEILLDASNELIIKKENLTFFRGQSLNSSNETIIYSVNNGQLELMNNDEYFTFFKQSTFNLLSNSTFISQYLSRKSFEYVNGILKETYGDKLEPKHLKILNFIFHLYRFMHFINSINVKLENEEFNIKYNPQEKLLINDKKEDINQLYVHVSSDEDLISFADIKQYENTIKKLTKFIKLFKPTLKSIDITKKVDGNHFHCFKSMNYGDYFIDTTYESSGIKKLIELFAYIDRSINGDIVFIDELDANIGGVLLNKLLEFIQEYGRGQLCFTSHSFEPMDVLKNSSKSIEFLGETGKLITWTKNGNYNPRKQYKDGMVKDSPFNIESYDFLKVFEIED